MDRKSWKLGDIKEISIVYNALLYSAILWYALLCYAMLCYAMLCYTLLDSPQCTKPWRYLFERDRMWKEKDSKKEKVIEKDVNNTASSLLQQ